VQQPGRRLGLSIDAGPRAASGPRKSEPFGDLIFDGEGQWSERPKLCCTDLIGTRFEGLKVSSGLVFDAEGDLSGTTCERGAFGFQSLFKLAPEAGGK
jgi:hypothetical protein